MCLSLIVATTQLSLRTEEDEVEADNHAVLDFGGIFEMHDIIQEKFAHQAKQADKGAEDENMQLIFGSTTPAPTWWHPAKSGGTGTDTDFANRRWPTWAWKAPLGPDDDYPRKDDYPLPVEGQPECKATDMQVLNFYALKQAKKRLPREGFNGTNFNGECFQNNFDDGWALNVKNYAKCFQRFYNVSLGCAQCIGKVYNMAFFNWSQPCYSFCKGRPNRRDGSHWCWEDCQSCMWYIGKQLTNCYGEPYDMQCRYARELGKEEWFEQNGVNPKR